MEAVQDLPVFGNGRVIAKEVLKVSGQSSVCMGIRVVDSGRQKVAIKIFRGGLAADWETCKREVVFLYTLLRHSNIVEVIDFYEKPFPSYVMPFIDGGDLYDHLENNGRFEGNEALALLRGITKGIRHLHRHKILHRVLKSPNVMLRQNQDGSFCPIIIDFGFGKSFRKSLPSNASHLTSDYPRGTAYWMAPEVVLNRQYSPKSDMYALGIIMWEVYTGHVPYGTSPHLRTVFALNKFVTEGGRPDMNVLSKTEISQTQKNLIQDLWQPEPGRRPSVDEALRKLGLHVT